MKKVCELCQGSGQSSYFKGVSRFVVSWDECPECGGLGFVFTEDGAGDSPGAARGGKPAKSAKKKKNPSGT